MAERRRTPLRFLLSGFFEQEATEKTEGVSRVPRPAWAAISSRVFFLCSLCFLLWSFGIPKGY